MSLCCDAIVMADTTGAAIGLNEVALGIAVPRYWCRVFIQRVGFAKGEPLLKHATLVQPKHALSIGLVDHVVEEVAELMPTSEALMRRMVSMPVLEGRSMTKASMRAELANEWIKAVDQEAEMVWGFLSDEATVRSLDGVMQKLQKRQHSKSNAESSSALKPKL